MVTDGQLKQDEIKIQFKWNEISSTDSYNWQMLMVLSLGKRLQIFFTSDKRTFE